MRKVIMSAILISLFNIPPVEATLSITSPVPACALLYDIGLATGGWINLGQNEFGCNSSYKNIGSSFPLANNLAYYVDGDKNSVTQAKLVLNVNDKSQETLAHSALLNSSEVLSIKITDMKLPQTIRDAITRGKPKIAKMGKAIVEVKRNNWPAGKGYELHVIFK